MEKYALELDIPYWGPGGMPRVRPGSVSFEAENDENAKEQARSLIPITSITRYRQGVAEGEKIKSKAVRLVRVIKDYCE